MSEQTTRRFRATLAQEITQWQQEGLIGSDLAGSLFSRYPVANQGSRLVTIALIVGAVLVGLGVILFVGSNWEHMARILKVVVVIGAILSSYIGAWYFKYEPGNRPKLGSALMLLGSLLYGAGIWLISQIFNFDTTLSQGLFLWAAGTVAVTLVTKSQPNAILMALLVPAWNLSQYNFTHDSSYIPIGSIFPFIGSMIAAMWISAKVRSRAATYVLLLGALIWVGALSGTFWAGMIVFGAFLFASHLWLRDKSDLLAGPFLYMGAVSGLIGGLMATFDKSGTDILVSQFNLAVLMALAIVPCFKVAEQRTAHQAELLGCLGFAIASPLISHFTGDLLKASFGNLMLLAMLVSLVVAGARLHKGALVNIAIVFGVIDIICRYFDMFYSMLDRSMFFVFGGIVLICAGAIAERNRRRLMGSFS